MTRLEFVGVADAVELQTFMPRFPKGLAFDRVGHNRWRLDLDLPPEARIEYRLGITSGVETRSILDPLNPKTARNPFGENSVAGGPGYREAAWAAEPAAGGTMSEVRVASLEYGGRRHHHVYTPSGHDTSSPLPLIAVHDGTDYVRYAGLARCIEHLIRVHALRPCRLLLLDPRVRHVEYVASDRHAAHLVGEVIPHIQR
ncbi:MAG: hypothetical protein OEW91_17430, partial [Acidimicrobiia bacterium]|nr:hypothetical protein [Acidimicrobiia bacterium]